MELDVYQPPICKPNDKDNWMLNFRRIWANVASDNPERSLERLQGENDQILRQMRIEMSFTGIALLPKIDVKRIFLTKSYMIILEQ